MSDIPCMFVQIPQKKSWVAGRWIVWTCACNHKHFAFWGKGTFSLCPWQEGTTEVRHASCKGAREDVHLNFTVQIVPCARTVKQALDLSQPRSGEGLTSGWSAHSGSQSGQSVCHIL